MDKPHEAALEFGGGLMGFFHNKSCLLTGIEFGILLFLIVNIPLASCFISRWGTNSHPLSSPLCETEVHG